MSENYANQRIEEIMAKFPVSVVKKVKFNLANKDMNPEQNIKFWETFYRIIKARKSKVLIIL